MGACWGAILVNDRRMLNNEILKEKNFRFLVEKLIRNIFWKRGFGIPNIVNIYLIDKTVTDPIKKTSDSSLSCWNYVKIFVY